MTDERHTDRADTDEPDGVPAYEASLRPPGESLGSGGDFADLPAEEHLSARETSRAGYDVDAVSGAGDPAEEEAANPATE
ncbi:hypothetical protein [Micromonospora sp. RL09-050-HVF-A]|uniref:hypothetical protein n=1 Tax=Micromonospora sp. RL09-050-HVF-A TaxID=1703433 RepID=UPI001C5ED248|nr:hypothetical protein [Micromonospora sp. RL09-050-HVF-A]MBW4701194.1 hypothetical protein [Micromonospora sp. RL09-050-HVF-A]